MKSAADEPDFRAIDRAAARWAARMEGGTLSGADREELRAWLEENPAHRWRFAHYQHVSAELDVALPTLAAAGHIEAPARPMRSRSAWGVLWFSFSAVALVVAVLGWWHSGAEGEPSRVITTRIAERQSVQLADGTRADLNAQTSLAVEFRAAERRVKLSGGEAFFAVAKNPERPFVVETPAGSIRVTGTTFNVRADGLDRLEVTVIEGTVEVRPQRAGADVLRLRIGDRVQVIAADVTRQQLTADVAADAGAWREGRVVFAATRLDEAVRRFAAFHGRSVVIAPAVAPLRLGGRFSLDDLKGFLESVEEALPVRIVQTGEGVISVTAR